MNKIIILLTAVLLFILFILAIVFSLNSRNEVTPETPGKSVPTPTTFRLYRIPTSFKGQQKVVINQTRLQALRNFFQDTPTYDNPDFKAYYSSSLGKFVVVKKTANANNALKAWLKQQGFSDQEIDAIIGNTSDSFTLINGANPANLTEEEKKLFDELKNQLPISTPDLDVIYDPEADVIIIDKKTPRAEYQLPIYIPGPILNNPDTVIIKDSTNGGSSGSGNYPQASGSADQELAKDVETSVDTIRTIFSFGPTIAPTALPTDIPQPTTTEGDGGTPPPTVSGTVPTVRLDFAAWGLPEPKADTQNGVRGYNQLLSQLRDSRATWATRELLNAEKEFQQRGGRIYRYLTTGWIWFENGSARWPDPYQVNCNDNRPGFSSGAEIFCSVPNFQIAGYQAADRKNDYVRFFRIFYAENELKSVMDRVISNSSKASSNGWRYSNTSIPSSISLNDISPSKNFFNQETQKYTLVLGKDPRMVIALNSIAVSDSDIIRALKTTCGYGYICATEKQVLSNIIAALYIFDNGSLNQPQPGGPVAGGGSNPSIPTVGNADIIGWSEQIASRLQRRMWNMFNGLTQRVSNGSYTTPYREGNVIGVGSSGLFWCTNMVISSHNLAGKTGLREGLHEGVIEMRRFTMQDSRYTYVDYLNSNKVQALQRVKPGCAFFFEQNPGVKQSGEHTGLVKSVDMDANGNGTLNTVESNNGRTHVSYPISQGNVRNTPRSMLVVGFACAK